MKNNKVIACLILVITLLLVNIIIFVTQKEMTSAGVINTVFLNLSIVIVSLFSIFGGKSRDELPLSKVPILGGYLLLTVITSILLFLIQRENVTLTIVLHILYLGIFLIAMLGNQAADNKTREDRSVVDEKIDNVRRISNQLKGLLATIKDRNLYKTVEKAYDGARSLNVNVKGDVSTIDMEILRLVTMLEEAVNSGNVNEVDDIVSKLEKHFIKRNHC